MSRGAGRPGAFQAGPGMVVSFGYVLFDAEGERVDASAAGDPAQVLVGFGDAPPVLERALEGLSTGGSCEVTLHPRDAFGMREADRVIEVDRSELPEGISAGDELSADQQDGSGVVSLRVLEVHPDRVLLDTNHPLAGQKIRLRVTVEGVRPADPEELDRAVERLESASRPPEALLPAERLLRRVPPSGRGGGAPPADHDPTS